MRQQCDHPAKETAREAFMTESNFRTIMGSNAREILRIMRYRNIKPLMVDAIQVNGPADVQTGKGVIHTDAGDWLMRDPHGNVNVCDDHYFMKNYAVLKDSGPLEQFRESTPHGGC
jgi:hypothetical protein